MTCLSHVMQRNISYLSQKPTQLTIQPHNSITPYNELKLMINHTNTKTNLFSIVNYILLLSNLSFISRINGFSLNIKTKVNPNTNRAELIECAKSLDESLALGEKIGKHVYEYTMFIKKFIIIKI